MGGLPHDSQKGKKSLLKFTFFKSRGLARDLQPARKTVFLICTGTIIDYN